MSEGYVGWFVEPIEQWSQFLGGCNWYTFHPIKIEFEDERIMGGIEITVVILGLGLRVRWNYTETDQVCEMKRVIDDLS